MQNTKDTDLRWQIGVGVGFDLGISDLITLSPIFQYRFIQGVEWESLDRQIVGNVPDEYTKSDLSYLGLGLVVTFRPDYTNRFR